MQSTRMHKSFLLYNAIFFNVFLLLIQTTYAVHPDTFLSPNELAHKYGYPIEIHEIITEDGYIISTYRIPHGKNGAAVNEKPILLMTGIMSLSDNFLINGLSNASWAYELADNGYDVWLGNNRGTRYGKKHLVLHPEQKEFWYFSVQEIGLYDLPATIDYILGITKKSRLSYLGISQGSTIFYIMCSLRPEYQKKIILASLLGPIGYLKHTSKPSFLLTSLHPKKLQYLLEAIGIYEVPPPRLHLYEMMFITCTFIIPDICVKTFRSSGAVSSEEFNDELLPLQIKCQTTASMYQLLHYAQQINSGHFRPFDYGQQKNLEIYGKLEPDDYPVGLIKVPIAIYYSRGDTFAIDKDVEEMCDALPNCVRRFVMPNKKWDHVDFVYSIHLKEQLIKPILEFSEQYERGHY